MTCQQNKKSATKKAIRSHTTEFPVRRRLFEETRTFAQGRERLGDSLLCRDWVKFPVNDGLCFLAALFNGCRSAGERLALAAGNASDPSKFFLEVWENRHDSNPNIPRVRYTVGDVYAYLRSLQEAGHIVSWKFTGKKKFRWGYSAISQILLSKGKEGQNLVKSAIILTGKPVPRDRRERLCVAIKTIREKTVPNSEHRLHLELGIYHNIPKSIYVPKSNGHACVVLPDSASETGYSLYDTVFHGPKPLTVENMCHSIVDIDGMYFFEIEPAPKYL